MKKKRKKKMTVFAVVLTVIICFITIILIFSFNKKNDVILLNYSIEDEEEMTLVVALADTFGDVRSLTEKNNGKDKYITFYSTYPLLSRFGKSEFEIELNQECENIYFNRGNRNFGSEHKIYKGEKYSLALRKNKETNEWEIIK